MSDYVREARQELFFPRPRPAQNMVCRRVNRLQNSIQLNQAIARGFLERFQANE